MLSYERALLGAGGLKKEPVYVEDVFSTWLYAGTGATQTIANGIDLSGEGGMVWIKSRSAALSSAIYDTERGATKQLSSNLTNAQVTTVIGATSYNLTGFNNNGFTLGPDYDSTVNGSGSYTYASWTFRKAPGFFDVVTYTGNGVDGRVLSHSLNSSPGFIIIKRTDTSANWYCWHNSFATGGAGVGQYIFLNQTSGVNNELSVFKAVSSSTITLSNNFNVNGSGGSFVAYLFAHDAGGFGDSGNESVIKCGSFTGANFTVDLGWEPQWLLVKRSDITSNWYLIDNMRGFPATGDAASLLANLANDEATAPFSITNTGFTYTSSTASYIYIAIRRPMKTPTSGTEVLHFNTRTGTGANLTTTGIGFPHDAVIIANRTPAGDWKGWFDRLRGNNTYLLSHETNAEATGSGYSFDNATGTAFLTTNNRWNRALGGTYIDYFFRRAPGFFDVVAYTGTGVARTVSHNLGVVPELMIIKARNGAGNEWIVYASPLGSSQYLVLNQNSAKSSFDSGADNTRFWNSTAPTASVFTISTNGYVNSSVGTYIAYLFASCPGVSKVGSYTGTGTTLDIDCGFTTGARFVLIKRTDSTGDWYAWDTARGIVSGNDPYLLLNSTAAEVTSTDYIDPLSSGFQISSSAPAAINASGGSFIFLAIA